VINFIWGAAGAFIPGISALNFVIWAEGETRGKRTQAVSEFIAALATGAIFAGGFAPVIKDMLAQGISVNGLSVHGNVGEGTVALTIGWASNYLWPRLLKKLGQKIDAVTLEAPKP
jgi:hypothetical protein